MSSIKQVQDLEKQMERLRRDNGNLRRMLQEREGQMDVDTEGMEHLPPQLPEMGANPKRRKRPTPMHDLSTVRSNLQAFSRGIWKSPVQFRQSAPSPLFDPQRPELPPRQTTDQLLHSFYGSAHTMFPILHWPTFSSGVDDLYRLGSQKSFQPAWLSTFFAALALGSLFAPDPHTHRAYRAAELLEVARNMIDPWNNDYVLENARALLLISICLNEMNLKSAAWTWLGSAVRIGQDLELHSESGPWPVIEGEMRRRVWWTTYILDRSLALELGRPIMIDDSDCDVSLPAGVDDHYIHEGGIVVPPGREPLNHSLLAIINVVRSYSALIKTLAAPMVAPSRLATFDQTFANYCRSFPPACDASSGASLSPHLLAPYAYVLHARLVLHRHNLAPTCPPEAAPNCAWVWAGGEREGFLSPTSPGTIMSGAGAGSGLFSAQQRTGLTDQEISEWGGWSRLDAAVRGLASGNSTPTPTSATWAAPLPPAIKIEGGGSFPPPPTPGSAPLLSAGVISSSGNSPSASSTTRSQDRLSIANII
ncbi:hypothetical protein VD0004_g3704 [Verticillium dahliae]|nr:hypothetical protein VD0004_g3704 [Verticillium dahliae]